MFRSKYLHPTRNEHMKYGESMNQVARCLIIKQIPSISVIDKDPEVVVGLLETLKEQILETRQEKKP